jgi:hypothetical protein
MNVPSVFDDIRPIEPEELPQIYDRLLSNPEFKSVLPLICPGIPFDVLAEKIYSCKTNLEFQKVFIYGFLNDLLKKASTGCEMDAHNIDPKRHYTFVSNHRDIVLDSAFLDKLMLDCGFSDTCEIGIGDNLLTLPWVKDLVRINKAYIVRRGLQQSRKLRESILLSQYMHFASVEKHQNLWMAQREGRAKDSNDLTQTAILKMMSKGGHGTGIANLIDLHIVPLAISYEYDPCDFLKAKELQQRRDNPDFAKGPDDDVISMRTGIMGFKGHIHYHCAPCIDDYLKAIDPKTPQQEMFLNLAHYIDAQIHANYRLYAGNYVALDILDGTNHSDKYTPEEKERFMKYIAGQLAKIDLPNRDDAYLNERLLTMYAWPARNYLAVNGLK